MNERLVKVSAAVGCIVLLVHLAVTGAQSIANSVSFGVSAAAVAGGLYDLFIWRLDPRERP